MNQVVDVFALIIADVSAKLGFDVYFHHGHMLEIANVISQMEGPDTDATWPIVCLLHDFKQPETYNGTDVTVTLLIIAPSMPTYLSEQRKELVFKPRLVPIYEQLKKSIAASKYIGRTSETKWPRIDHYFYGSADVMKSANILHSWVDCIELDGLELTVHIPCDDVDVLAPRLLWAVASPDGDYITLKFNKDMVIPINGEYCFNWFSDNGTNELTFDRIGFGESHSDIILVPETYPLIPIPPENILTLKTYTEPMYSEDGHLLQPFANFHIINNSQ